MNNVNNPNTVQACTAEEMERKLAEIFGERITLSEYLREKVAGKHVDLVQLALAASFFCVDNEIAERTIVQSGKDMTVEVAIVAMLPDSQHELLRQLMLPSTE